MQKINVTKQMIEDKSLKMDWYYYPSFYRPFIRAGASVEEPGEYWESEFYYIGVIDDYETMAAIDEKIQSGVIKGEINGYEYERVVLPGGNSLAYEVYVRPSK